ncbi:hypothetical protein A2U01_0036457, partial [Trifolium medium]|nr:hypothetical protein [Trifolium medium]
IDPLFDPKIEKTLKALKKAAWLAQTSTFKEDTLSDKSMGDLDPPPPPPRRTMGDYCRRTDTDQVSIGFRPANPMNFDIKSNVLVGLREN